MSWLVPTVTASIMIAQFFFGDKVRCHNGLWKFFKAATWVLVSIASTVYQIATSKPLPQRTLGNTGLILLALADFVDISAGT
jgi:hypothetical protein